MVIKSSAKYQKRDYRKVKPKINNLKKTKCSINFNCVFLGFKSSEK